MNEKLGKGRVRTHGVAMATCVGMLFGCDQIQPGSDELGGPTGENQVESSSAALTATTTATFNGHRYALYPNAYTWQAARSACEARGGHLPIIETAAENNFLANMLYNAGMTRGWIGATDEVTEGTWRWVNGQPMTTYSNWASGEPNNAGGAENWAAMYYSGTWLDLGATWTVPFVCEFGDHSYRLLTNNSTWSNAASDCETRGGYLATSNSVGENTTLTNFLVPAQLSHAWLGMSDIAKKGTHQWVTWETSTYRNWAPGEPNNAGGIEDYVEIRPSTTWNDLPATWQVPGLCEFGRPTFNTLAAKDLRTSSGDDLVMVSQCLPFNTSGGGCKSCPASSVSWSLDANQQAASVNAKFFVLEKGQGARDPEGRAGYNILQLKLQSATGTVTNTSVEFGTSIPKTTVNYRPNGDAIIDISSLLSGGQRVLSANYIEDYSLYVLCTSGPPTTLTRSYSRLSLAN